MLSSRSYKGWYTAESLDKDVYGHKLLVLLSVKLYFYPYVNNVEVNVVRLSKTVVKTHVVKQFKWSFLLQYQPLIIAQTILVNENFTFKNKVNSGNPQTKNSHTW